MDLFIKLAIIPKLIETMTTTIDFRKEMDSFFSQAADKVKEPEFTPIVVTNDEMQAILKDRTGLTDALQRNFPALCYRDKSCSKPRAFMEALFVWEMYGRTCTVGDLSSALAVKATSIPQYMYYVRHALNATFGLDIVVEGDTYKLMSMDELRQRSEHLAQTMEAYGNRLVKLARAVESLEKCGYGDNPQLQAAKVATGSVVLALQSLTGDIKNPQLKALAGTPA